MVIMNQIRWPFDDLEDDPPLPESTATTLGKPKIELLDKLVIPCHSIENPETRLYVVPGMVATRAGPNLAKAAVSYLIPPTANILLRHSAIWP
jgi:hypothetical protein